MQSLIKKWLEVQKAIKPIEKDSQNPHFKSWYFDISKLLADVKPILSAQGLVLMQPITVLEGRPAILTTIIDAETCEKIEAPMLLPDIQDPQKMGAVISYYRRYALVSLLALEGEDDDAEGAKPATTQQKPVQQATQHSAAPSGDWSSFMLTFGKHKGKTLGEADPSYLSWLSGTEIKNPALASALAGWSAAQNPSQELPTIKVEEREREEWKPPVIDDGDVPVDEIPFN